MTALEQGQSFLAMHQFAGAIKAVAEDTQSQENNRLRLGMLVRDVPRLRAILTGNTAAFSPDGKRIVTASRRAGLGRRAASFASLRGTAGQLRHVQPRRHGSSPHETSGAGLGRRDRPAPRLTPGAHRSGSSPPRSAPTASGSSPHHRTRRRGSGTPRPASPSPHSGAHRAGSTPPRSAPTASGSSPHQTTRQRGSGTPRPASSSPHFRGTPTGSAPPRSAPTASGSSPHQPTRRRRSGTPRPASLSPHFRGTPAYVNSAAFSPDGKRVVTASGDKTARVWDAATGKLLTSLQGHTDWSSPPRSAPTASGSSPHHATRRRGSGTPPPASSSPHFRGTPATSTPPRSAPTASGSSPPHDKTARVWDAETGQLVASLQGHTSRSTRPRSAPTASGSSPPHATRRRGSGTPRPASPSPHFRGTPIGHLRRLQPRRQADRHRIMDDTARVWDAATGQLVASLQGHTDRVPSAAFSPDGKRVVTASVDKTARVWDAETGQPVASLQGHTDQVHSAAFSPDGKRIVTAIGDSTARVWLTGFGRGRCRNLADLGRGLYRNRITPGWCGPTS